MTCVTQSSESIPSALPVWERETPLAQCQGRFERTRLDSNQRHSVSKTDALATETLQNKGDLNVVEEVYAVLHAVELKSDAQLPPTDPDLSAVVNAWAKLPSALKAGIVAMVKAVGDAK